MAHLLYLDPYSFIFEGVGEYVIYNSLNYEYVNICGGSVVDRVFKELCNPDNGYGVILDDVDMEDTELCESIRRIMQSFSGECIPFTPGQTKPFIFKPDAYVNAAIEDPEPTLRQQVMLNLDEVTFFMQTSCVEKCRFCGKYQTQQKHCYCSEKEGECLTLNQYRDFLSALHGFGVSRINLVGTGLVAEVNAIALMLGFEVSCYVTFREENYALISDLVRNGANVIVQVNDHSSYHHAHEVMTSLSKTNVKWNFWVSSEVDVKELDAIDFPDGYDVSTTPFYSGDNLDFFRDYVFLSKSDIIKGQERRQILRRQILNEYFFGSIMVDPQGDFYVSHNLPKLGNLLSQSLKSVVDRLSTDRDSPWLMTRKLTSCSACVNRYLCPSISDYELALGRCNLCHIKT